MGKRSVAELEEHLIRMSRRQEASYNKSREATIRRVKSELAIATREGCLPANLDPINPNRRENLFARSAKEKGWTAVKRRWPDYLCWKDGEIMEVEVKPDYEDLSEHQKLMVSKLKQAGVKCFIWEPTPGLREL